jgi:glycosyltransferase involved in cell wall biosynthesis
MIALIAAFPPPISGQSLAAGLLRDGLRAAGADYVELDLSEPIGGEGIIRRLLHLSRVEGKLIVLCLRHRDLVVYSQLGHGKLALIRDMVFMATAAVFGKPCVGHVHGSGFRKAFEMLPGALRMIERRLVARLSAAVVLCEDLRSMFEGLLSDDRIFAVDNGIDPAFVAMTEEKREKTEGFCVLFLSNLLTAKGFSTLLRAAVMARDAGKDWQFVFCGAKIADQDVDIDAFIADYHLDNVIVRGVVEGVEKHQAYREADVFVLPSSYEGQPLCILEAMFESLPVITTRVGGIPDIFKTDNRGVRFVEVGDASGLYEQLELLSVDRERCDVMGQANRAVALSRFTAEGHLSRMMALLGYSQ